MTKPQDVTMVRGAIHNPAEPRHFMRIAPSPARQTALVGQTVVADSDQALVVKEVGHDIYDAVIYFPRADIDMDALVKIEKTTHCPIKGDTEYFDLNLEGGLLAEAAWSYPKMIAGGDELSGHVAFDTSKVEVRAKLSR